VFTDYSGQVAIVNRLRSCSYLTLSLELRFSHGTHNFFFRSGHRMFWNTGKPKQKSDLEMGNQYNRVPFLGIVDTIEGRYLTWVRCIEFTGVFLPKQNSTFLLKRQMKSGF